MIIYLILFNGRASKAFKRKEDAVNFGQNKQKDFKEKRQQIFEPDLLWEILPLEFVP